MHCTVLSKTIWKKRKKDKLKLGENEYDVGIIGGGAAGLSAASMSSYMGLKTVIFEGGSWGGLLTRFCPDKLIENYPGLTDKITPLKLIDSLRNDAKKKHVDLKQEYVNELEMNEQFKTLRADSGTYKVKIVVLASGSYPEKSGISGVEKFATDEGGVFYLTTDPSKLTDKRVLVYGKGYNAVSAARCLVNIAGSITLVTGDESFKVPEQEMDKLKGVEGLKIFTSMFLEEIQGRTKVEKVFLHDTCEDEMLEIFVDAVVLATEMVPNIEIFEKLEIETDESGFVQTDKYQKTNIPGVYAIGNVTSDIDLLVVAEAQGAIVAHDAYKKLRLS